MGKKGRRGVHKGTTLSAGGSGGDGGPSTSDNRPAPPESGRPATAPAASSSPEQFPLPGCDYKKKKGRGGGRAEDEASGPLSDMSPIDGSGHGFPSLGLESPSRPSTKSPWSPISPSGSGPADNTPQPSFWAMRQQQQQVRQPFSQAQQPPRHEEKNQQQGRQTSLQQPVSPPSVSPPSQRSPEMPSTPKTPSVDLSGDIKSLHINFQIPKRNQRKKMEKRGDRITVETNHLALRIKNPNMVITHYDVTISPEKPFRFYRPAMNAIQKKCYPNRYPAFDGKKNLYSYPELPFHGRELVETVTIFDEERQADREVTVTIKYASSVDISIIQDYMKQGATFSSTQDAVQALDIVLRQPAANKFVTVGRSFFTPPPGRVISLGDGLDLWYGFFQSAVIGWKPYLNIDVAHKGFPTPSPCVKLLCEVAMCQCSDLEKSTFCLQPSQQKNFEDNIKNLKVICEIPHHNTKRTYKIIGIGECALKNRFCFNDRATKATQEMTVEQYYAKVYKYRLRYPYIPCLKAGSAEKPVALPMELCTIVPGQITLKKMTEVQTKTMVREAAVDTDKRKDKIIKSMETVKYHEDKCLKEFGLTVSSNFTKVEARILAAPTIDYRDKARQSTVKVNVEKGVWKLYNYKFLNGADLTKWTILCANRWIRDEDLKNVAEGLTDHGRQCGLSVAPPQEIVTFEQLAKIEDYFRRCEKEGIKLVVVVLPDKGLVTYATVKKLAELQVGILTQCLKSFTVQKRLNQATFVNILQKINAKLNGVNHNITSQMWPELFRRPVMVVGADVTHPAPDQVNVPSIAAVAASHDPKAFRYNMIWKLQPPRVEVIKDLQMIMVEQLKFFYRTTRQKPERILFYRDGVSEGQFRTILDVELCAIRRACSSLQADYEPPITFLVVQKRHHTRFFPSAKDADGRNKNVPAGTIVDTEITHPTELDFYLVSHASIQGTARPTKYHVLWDDAGMAEQEIEEITYYLCHLFTRCTRSVSYPAPTYYAHLAAFRARSYTAESEGPQRMNIEELEKEQLRRKVKDGILKNNPMFFV